MSRNDWQADNPLVLDTNTALSGRIGGATRKLILDVDRNLRFPEPSFDEIRRNRSVIQERAGLSVTAIDELIDRLFKNITLVPEEDVLMDYQTAAEATSPHPDADHQRHFEDRSERDASETRAGDLPEAVREYGRSRRAIRTDEWKLIRSSDGSTELYHVASDLAESENVAEADPDVVADLGEELDAWLGSFEHAERSGDVSMREETKRRLEDLGYLQ